MGGLKAVWPRNAGARFPEGERGLPGVLLEEMAEMAGMLEATLRGDFVDEKGGPSQQIRCCTDPGSLKFLKNGPANKGFETGFQAAATDT